MTETDPANWNAVLSAAKAAKRAERDGSGDSPQADASTVTRIVEATRVERHQWILRLWKSLSLKLAAAGLVLVVLAALYYWKLAADAPPPPIIPLPNLEEFSETTVTAPER